MAKLEKYLFPGFLFFFEVIFLVIFGLLVKYDARGAPDAEREAAEAFDSNDSARFIRELESSLSTTKVYPCKLMQSSAYSCSCTAVCMGAVCMLLLCI